ncbi:14 kDa phosphohistidine phosphatase isoform X3 [Myiozetetes cayanensis]|uniref:14 kDa phosphohistidine phosphatase isoform X3 n=1 Tax=Myiozetetes cayanensis TaxID=478635 RepID=UPI00215E855E|nr:14 kDa phosphohistidine phosphatase isoform X3 [Myiozetetes cayanensis]
MAAPQGPGPNAASPPGCGRGQPAGADWPVGREGGRLGRARRWLGAAAEGAGRAGMAGAALSAVPAVQIDGHGVFKYVLLRVRGGAAHRDIVRGHGWAEYHADLFERTAEELARHGLSCECLGGGRLAHRPEERKIHVYGYSVGFGRADHAVTTEKLKAEYPDYEITWADEGY